MRVRVLVWPVLALLVGMGETGCDQPGSTFDPEFSRAVAIGEPSDGELLELALFRGDSEEVWPRSSELSTKVALFRTPGDSEAAALMLAALRGRNMKFEQRAKEVRCVLYLQAKGTHDRLGIVQVLLRDRSVYVTPMPRGDSAGFEANPLENALTAVLGNDPCALR